MAKRTRLNTSDKVIRYIIQKKLSLANGSSPAKSHSSLLTHTLLVVILVLNGIVLLPRVFKSDWAPTQHVSPSRVVTPSPASPTPHLPGERVTGNQPEAAITPTVRETPSPAAEAPASRPASLPASTKMQIEILNGCGVSGLARRATRVMRKLGFDVVNTDNYRSQNVGKSFIIDRVGNKENALKLAKAVGIPESRIRVKKDPSLALDATLVLGKDYKTLTIFKK